MKIDDRTYFEEEQRIDSKWIWFFVFFLCLTLIGVCIPFYLDKETDIIKISIVMGAIVFSDVLIFYLFKTMKLEIAITNIGLQYRFFAMIASSGIVEWKDVTSISFRKSPQRGYGKKYKFRYGEVYTMNTKSGVEIEMKNGKKKFFSLKDLDAFRSGFQKLNLTIKLNSVLN